MAEAKEVRPMAQAEGRTQRPSFTMLVRVPEEHLLQEYDYVTSLPVLVQVRKKIKRTETPTPARKDVIADLATETPDQKGQEQPKHKEQEANQKEQPKQQEEANQKKEANQKEANQKGQPSQAQQQVDLLDVLGSLSAPTSAYPVVRKLHYQEPHHQVLGATLGPDVATRLGEKKRAACAEPTLAADDYFATVHAAIGQASTLDKKTEIVDLSSESDTMVWSALAAAQSSQPLEFSDSLPTAEDPYEQCSQFR